MRILLLSLFLILFIAIVGFFKGIQVTKEPSVVGQRVVVDSDTLTIVEVYYRKHTTMWKLSNGLYMVPDRKELLDN